MNRLTIIKILVGLLLSCIPLYWVWTLSLEGHGEEVIEILHSQMNLNDNQFQNLESLYVQARNGGVLVGESFIQAKDWKSLVRDAMDQFFEKEFDQILLCFGENYKKAQAPLRGKSSYRSLTGAKGVQFQFGRHRTNYCGIKSVTTNRTPWKILKELADDSGISLGHMNSESLEMMIYENKQFFIDWKTKQAVKLFRGNRLVSQKEISKSELKNMTSRLAGWLINNTDIETGQLQYKYWPSSGKHSKSNNMIRQFMATYALQVWSQEAPKITNLAIKNLEFNLKEFYREQNELGFIEYRNKRKLGAAGLAALAIFKSSGVSRFQNQFEKLKKTIEHQWQSDGSFRTFILQERNDLHNFYPGEALYFWAHLLERKPNNGLLKKFMKSAKYYMKWHGENLNPAFIPWHTQAYYKIWKINKDKFLKDSIFKMNDWLVSQMQDLEKADGYSYPDFEGRFYYPRGGFGPPHASSTGVYLEGLIDAWKLAKEQRDLERVERYRKSILSGLRHARQLEFSDPEDMFYIKNKAFVYGGLRTQVYNNEVRMDNIQHNLLAFIKILKQFEEIDYNF